MTRSSAGASCYKVIDRTEREAFEAERKRGVSPKEREDAERRLEQAKRERCLLLNDGSYEQSDFYPHRYLASEGFLPGYNFPRLPLRAIVAGQDGAHMIDRGRFFSLTEFGPQNRLYHEGQQHQIDGIVVPADGQHFRTAKLYDACGYAHPGEAASSVDLCEHCGVKLDGSSMQFPQKLLEQTIVRTRPRERIPKRLVGTGMAKAERPGTEEAQP